MQPSTLTLEMLKKVQDEVLHPPATLEELEHKILMLDPIEKTAFEIHEWVNREFDKLAIKYGTMKALYIMEVEGQKVIFAPPGVLSPTEFQLGRLSGMPVYISNYL